jgi:tetratricopeptide (TPR) repeat protein
MLFASLALMGLFSVPPSLFAASEDLDAAYKNLKDAEAKKDPALVRKWAQETSKEARKILQTPEPTAADEKESWKNRLDYARQVDTYTEYSMFATALQTADPAAIIDLTQALEQQNPKSEYLVKLGSTYLMAVAKSTPDKIVPAAEKVALLDPNNEDALLILADGYLSAKQTSKALEASEKLIAVLSNKPAPEGLTEQAWTKKKTASLTRAHWIAGVVQGEANQYAEADRHLRAALPTLDDKQMQAAALFYLGVANYKMGLAEKDRARLAEAARFSEQCAALPGPYQAPAQRNARAIRAEIGPTKAVRKK